MAEKPSRSTAKLLVRQAKLSDAQAIVDLSRRVYGDDYSYTPEMVAGQLTHFHQGQFVAIYEDLIVGYCATFRIAEDIALKPHTWRQVTGAGYGSRHDAHGDWLYGMEVCVDPKRRGLRIGRRLYSERKKLCAKLNLKGIVFGGRLPGLARRIKQYGSPQAYVEAVQADRLRDGTLSFQLRNGFELIGVLQGYLPSDKESLGFAAHLVWRNPNRAEHPVVAEVQRRGHLPDVVRVATVQYQQRRIAAYEDFATQVEYFVDVAADYDADFVVFPELFTLQLLSVENKKLSPADSMRSLTSYTERFCETLTKLAVQYNINIIGGTHPTHMPEGDIHNNCYVALRDGSLHVREKLHPTPNERHWWKISGGEGAQTIMTDCGPIGIMICYDAQFPELARHLCDQGAMLLFVPFCTDVRQGFLRVRNCSAARAIENQCYVVLSGNVGNLPGVNNFDIQYAQSCILTPCDFPFATDGIAADTTPNVEAVAFADLRLDALLQARASGTVQNLKDRRHDLYHVNWRR
ncbi:carbon-nitrogen hydrolase family protein [Pseudomarimonas arenosa]|uniref:Carbon-nitrogen hydrolase family protein n=1 Tax=Pseudomarimonas arenosa TaxID=2774145 RepID=A0AAW3ZKJ7_9GAMM|nr:carbon-nitrogen hydrolase family protein [Pseudomarimonas arenosa]